MGGVARGAWFSQSLVALIAVAGYLFFCIDAE
jgi:hypothetical protein